MNTTGFWRATTLAAGALCLSGCEWPVQIKAGCTLIRSELFAPSGSTQRELVGVVGAQEGAANRPTILFEAPLRVNTDGAPNSYHPDDLRGTSKAINSICHAVTLRPAGTSKPITCAASIPLIRSMFDQLAVKDVWAPPAGYTVRWQSVIAARENAAKQLVPCTFRSGPYAGYLGSLTALKQGVSQKGECEVLNQLDQRFVPGLVLAGNPNPMRDFGASRGDLVLALNPRTGVFQAAVIADDGPEDNLGEGSVALNMALLGITNQPTTYTEAIKLDTGRQEIIVATLPGTKMTGPFTAGAIEAKLEAWAGSNGFVDAAGLARRMKECAPLLNSTRP